MGIATFFLQFAYRALLRGDVKDVSRPSDILLINYDLPASDVPLDAIRENGRFRHHAPKLD